MSPPAQPPPDLPIDAVLPELLDAIRGSGAAVLQAPTGAGKTTRVPGALLDAGLAGTGSVLVLEPRRLAARAAARRVADERGARLGGAVGYAVRFDDRTGPDTTIAYLTEGLFVRRLHDDPFLQGVGAVVLDEVHERHLDTDLALGMVRRVREEARPDLPLVVMSATLAAEELARFLGGAPVVTSEGRAHPVEVLHLPHAIEGPAETAVVAGVRDVLGRTEGDVLVFLPGIGEIRRAHTALERLAAEHALDVYELYGDLPAREQDAVLRAGPRRKVVLSTNVAESSVTIENVAAVVDTGLARVMRHDPSVGLDRLVLERISRASAEQRKGRAGRTGPGCCARLWTRAEHKSLAERDDPEILRVDLAGPVLQLRDWGETDLSTFPWPTLPPTLALAQAHELLRRLGALDGDTVTALGRRLVRLPVHPRLGRLLLEGQRHGVPRRAALAAALLSEREPFRRGDARRRAAHRSSSDVLDRVAALEAFESNGTRGSDVGEVLPGGARHVLRVRDQLARFVGAGKPGAEEDGGRKRRGARRRAGDGNGDAGAGDVIAVRDDPDEALRRALLAALPDRLARRREPGSARGVLVGGRGVRLAPTSAVTEAPLFVCAVLDGGGSGDAVVRLASAVEREWLPSESVREELTLAFDAEREAVTARARVLFEDLVLEERPAKLPGGGEVARVLADEAAGQLDRALPLDDDAVAGWLARVRCLAAWMPELELPVFDEPALVALLPKLCTGRRSFAELRKAPLLDVLRGALEWKQLRALESQAPERLAVPSGSHVRLRYEVGCPPVLAARIQELFGMTRTPTVAGGRVPVVMHLLGPNMRVQQVTDDLASFWANTYQQVRKDLRRRYPKHAWPEDPTTAVASRRPGR